MKLYKSAASALLAAAASLSFGAAAHAEPTPYIGQITWTANSFCPREWAETNGQLIQISSNTALFSLIGCQFGGDCQTTFALPNLQGRSMVGSDSQVSVGTGYGAPDTTMTMATMPGHSHILNASDRTGTLPDPLNNDLAEFAAGAIYSDQAPGAYTFGSGVITTTGGNLSFPISQPTLTMRACIATFGIFPSRN
jgi:microcystin-dependent protein